MQHPGYLINIVLNKLDKVSTIMEAKIDEMIYQKNKGENKAKYLFACCLKGLNEQG